MNTTRLIATIIFASAAFSAHARDPVSKIVLNCPVSRMPSMQDVANVVGTTNFQSTNNARGRVIELAKQACKRGAGYVNIVSGVEPTNAVAQQREVKSAASLTE
ncbi:MAG TPA: hypothetical protein VIE67_00945 [Rudaea sp.]|jgi:uncharacterized protein YceH (UPF0502 family)|uniref:hypothetical protein n=1 Tax=Rudaea sp. TaxID=2136325 RepID=UPI002F93CE44